VTAAIAAPSWREPPADLALGAGELHVWRVALDRPAATIAALARVLADDERARAARFHFDRDRHAYTLARGALRTLAGRYLGRPPSALGFGYQARGKPYLLPPDGDRLRFNVSHSGEVAVIGFAREHELGVDVERRRAMQDLESLAHTSFSPDEHARFCALAPPDREAAFFRCWSRKEAFIKATGEGMSQLAAFDVSLEPGQPARLLRVDGEPPGAPRWLLADLPDIPGYAAALAGARHGLDVACWNLDLDHAAAFSPA
jgi:4'-phosphopantetheinyl transferase